MDSTSVTQLRSSATAVSHRPDAATEPRLVTELVTLAPETTTAAQPVTVGLPFPKGTLTDGHALSLSDPDGRRALLQTEPLARWSDGSVKWLLLDFVCPAGVDDRSRWALRQDTQTHGRSLLGLRIEEVADALSIDTGKTVFVLGRKGVPAIRQVKRSGRDVVRPESFRVVLTDERGRPEVPRAKTCAVESRGPVRATVRWEGVFLGRVPCRVVARCCFFSGTGLVRLRLTVHNPNRARHAGGLWDLGDPGSMLFRDLTVEMQMASEAGLGADWKAECGHEFRRLAGTELEIFQASSGGEHWNSRNHVNRHGQVPCPFRGYRTHMADRVEEGLRASPVVALEAGGRSVTAAVPEFWQQFPKAVEVSGSTLKLRLFPEQFGDLFELQGGEQKTHTVWLNFGEGGGPTDVLDWVHGPVAVTADPEWYAASSALPHLAPEQEGRLDDYLRDAVRGPKSFFAGREAIDEFGWRNFGEVYADHEVQYFSGPRPLISHYNNQYDVVFGSLLQYLRSGDRRWAEVFEPLARHVIDIDLYRTDQDKAAYNGGLFWFTDHYKDAGASTHRTYTRSNQTPGQPYGGGPGSCHNFSTGLLHYYYLTGHLDARDAVLSLADWVVAMDDGRGNVLGLIDDGPTGVASSTFLENYQGPGRGPGLSIYALIDGWLVSGRRNYLDKAEELIRRVIHPTDDVAARDLLDVEKYWSYPVFLSALARYLGVKAEAGELDGTYAFARASLLRYAAWMADHEVAYFDQAEKLEYPTETWAAQEFRKANVLRLAAAHADEPLRSRLLQRGEELGDRAWQDLARFETRHSARAVAIVMVEGTVDAFFRARPGPTLPAASGTHDFGPPTTLVPQKARVKALLKSPRGWLRVAWRLLDARNWFRVAWRRP